MVKEKKKNNKKIILTVAIIAIIIGCFIPIEKDYIDSENGRHIDSTTRIFNTIEKFAVYVSVPPSRDNYMAVAVAETRDIIKFSRDGVCTNKNDCREFYYFPQNKSLHTLDFSSTVSTSLSSSQRFGANIYDHSNMKCFIYGIYCPNYSGYSFREIINYTNISIARDAIIKEYSTTSDCTQEDKKKISLEYTGNFENCTKDWSSFKTIKADTLFK